MVGEGDVVGVRGFEELDVINAVTLVPLEEAVACVTVDPPLP